MTNEQKKVAAASEAIKFQELVKAGVSQKSTSNGTYLNFPLAVRLTEKNWRVHFSPSDVAKAQMLWKEKFGMLEVGLADHEVDEKDGFCFTCGKFHSGEVADVVRTVYTTGRFKKEVQKAVVCTNTHLEEDGFCGACGKNHYGGEREAVPDQKVIKATTSGSPYRDLHGVSYRELRLDTGLWKMGTIAQIDAKFDED